MQPRIQKQDQNFFIKNRIELLLGVVIVLFLIIMYFQFNPPYLTRLSKNLQVIEEIADKTGAKSSEAVAIRKIDSVNDLRSQNSIMAEVYSQAQNGDYFVVFDDRIVIYRDGSDEIIYDGPTPAQIQADREAQLRQIIAQKTRERGLSFEENETLQLTAVTDAESLKQTAPTFYEGLQSGDVIGIFPNSGIIVIYRPSTQTIINSGVFATTIG